MRLLAINTFADPSTAHIRRRFPGKVLGRPVINTLPLASGGRRVLPVEMLTESVVAQLEYLVSIGNIKVVELGARTPVNFAELRRRLRLPPAPSSESSTPASPDPAVPPESLEESTISPKVLSVEEECSYCHEPFPVPVELHHAAEECVPTEQTEAAPPVDLDLVLAVIETAPPVPPPAEPEPGPGETFVLPGDIDGLIRGAKNKALVAILAIFGKSGAGKSKLALVSEVSEVLSGDPDPLLANRAVALLRSRD
jgi:hypothetical protein